MRSTSHHLSESLLKFSSASVVEPSTLERNNDDDDARDLLKKLCLRLRTVTHHGGGDGAHDNRKRNQASPDDVANVIRRIQNMASSLKVTRKQLASWMLKSPLPPEKTGRKNNVKASLLPPSPPTVYMLACEKGCLRTVEALVQAGCRTMLRNAHGRTGWDLAKACGHATVTDWLTE